VSAVFSGHGPLLQPNRETSRGITAGDPSFVFCPKLAVGLELA